MRNSLTVLSIAAFVIAIVAWLGVWFLFSDISSRLVARAQSISSVSSQSAKQASAIATHTFLGNSVSQRSTLDAAVGTDVVGIANQITAASKAAGVQSTIGSATVISTSASAGVSEVEFVVQSSGTFAQIWRAAELFQSLPLASKVSELDFQEQPNTPGKSTQWQLTSRIDVLTSSQLSS